MPEPLDGLDESVLNMLTSAVKREIELRTTTFSNYEKSYPNLRDCFLMILLGNALRRRHELFHNADVPPAKYAVEFYRDILLLRLDRLALVVEPVLDNYEAPLSRALLRRTRELTSRLSEIGEKLFREVFSELSNKVESSPGQFVEDCKKIGEGVDAVERIALEDDLFDTYRSIYAALPEEKAGNVKQ